MKLNIELVPKTAWGVNLRSLLKRKDWDFLRKRQYKIADGVCQICGDKGTNQRRKYDLECHEQWHYDDETHIQTLKGVIALCPWCHEVVHFGHTELQGRGTQALQHMMHINQCDKRAAINAIKDVQRIWADRSKHAWKIDMSWLDADNIRLKDGV